MRPERFETRTFVHLSEEKRGRIISASIDEFSEHGFEAASMNRVVRTAGISKGALFKYFQTKSGLFNFVYEITFNQVKEYLREVRDKTIDDDFFIRLEKIMAAGVRFIREHPRLSRIYFHILHTGDSPHSTEILQKLHAEALKFIRSIIADGIERGDLRDDLDVNATGFMVESTLNRFLQAHQLDILDPSLELFDAKEEKSILWIKKMVDVFRRGLSKAQEPIEWRNIPPSTE